MGEEWVVDGISLGRYSQIRPICSRWPSSNVKFPPLSTPRPASATVAGPAHEEVKPIAHLAVEAEPARDLLV